MSCISCPFCQRLRRYDRGATVTDCRLPQHAVTTTVSMACVINTHNLGNIGNLSAMTNNKLTCKKPCIAYGMNHLCLDMSVYHFEVIKKCLKNLLFVIIRTRSKK
mmetsp:Transcript_37381/g.37711  ORF Transcript_37381/g.37711 Transcript_37381/m.37711 type:complete len:105 (-) Transcript_37381:753-1067(-)